MSNNYNITNITNAWYNIEDFLKSDTIVYNNLSQIEKGIIDNNYNLIENLIKKGETIYKNNILCNGLYQTKFNVHPLKCHSVVCYKTLVYYGLWMNYFYYSNIFIKIIELLDDGYCKFNTVGANIKAIYDLMISINCCDEINKFLNFYDHTYANYAKINKCFDEHLDIIIYYLEKNYSVDSNVTDNNSDSNLIKVECYKNKLGKFYDFFQPIESTRLIELARLTNLEKKYDTNASVIIGKLKYYWDNYKINNKIVKLLFSQQALEYYKYVITSKLYQLEHSFELIISNPYININHTQHNQNIYSLTMTQQNKHEMIAKIKTHGGNLPTEMTIVDVINKCYSGMTKEIIRNSSTDFLDNIENLLKIIFNRDQMMSTDKIEIFEILMNRQLLDNINGLIELCLSDIKSFSLLEKISEKKSLISKANQSDIILCIKLLKHRELDILLSNNPNLIEEKYMGYQPILHYFDITHTDNMEEILTLNTLLKFKCDLEVTNVNGDTPLLCSINKQREKSCGYLLKSGSDVFFYNAKGHNSLHTAILVNNINIITLLIKHNNSLVNIYTKTNDVGMTKIHPLIFAINSANPVLTTQLLLAENNIDCNFSYEGNGVLHYLIKFDLDINTKNILFKNLIMKDFNLLEQCKIDMKPLVVKSVEKNLYDIVVMIMDKLLEKEEIKFEGYDKLKNISKIVDDPIQRNIIVKDTTTPNFYSLVMYYLKNNKKSNQPHQPHQPHQSNQSHQFNQQKYYSKTSNELTDSLFYSFLYVFTYSFNSDNNKFNKNNDMNSDNLDEYEFN